MDKPKITDCIACDGKVSSNATCCPHCGEPEPARNDEKNVEGMIEPVENRGNKAGGKNKLSQELLEEGKNRGLLVDFADNFTEEEKMKAEEGVFQAVLKERANRKIDNSSLEENQTIISHSETLGIIALFLPVCGATYAFAALSSTTVLESFFDSTFILTIVVVILGTASLIAIEASNVGAGTVILDKAPNPTVLHGVSPFELTPESEDELVDLWTEAIESGDLASAEEYRMAYQAAGPERYHQPESGPVAWFFCVLLLWVCFFPMWMVNRSKYGLKDYGIISGIITLAFTIAMLFLNYQINESQGAAMSEIERMQHMLTR